jgi:hypothetical protein
MPDVVTLDVIDRPAGGALAALRRLGTLRRSRPREVRELIRLGTGHFVARGARADPAADRRADRLGGRRRRLGGPARRTRRLRARALARPRPLEERGTLEGVAPFAGLLEPDPEPLVA